MVAGNQREAARLQHLGYGDRARGKGKGKGGSNLQLLPPGKNVEQAGLQIRRADGEVDLNVPCVTGYKIWVAMYITRGSCFDKACSSME